MMNNEQQQQPDDRLTGLGDVIKRITDFLGIKLDNCGCMERQEWLNKKFPFPERRQQ